MKKIFSLLLIISLCFVGNIYGASSASGGNTSSNTVNGFGVTNCNLGAPVLTATTTFRFSCTITSNDNTNDIQIKSVKSGKLLNDQDNKLTPLSIAISGTASYTASSASAAPAAVSTYATTDLTSSFEKILDWDATTSGSDVTQTLAGTIGINLHNTAGYTTGTAIYKGTYSDTLHLKVVQQ